MSGKKRQFDVVVRAGPDVRQTLTVIEVQDRGVKLGYEKLGALHEKATAVGASHLICVSTAGFVADAIQRAKGYGPRVRLVTLEELEQGGWPLNLATGHLFVYAYGNGHFDMKAELDPAHRAAFDSVKDVKLTIEDKVFERNASLVLLSARDLHSEAMKRYRLGIPSTLKSHEAAIFKYVPGANENLLLVLDGARARVQFIELKTRVDLEVIPIPISTFEYRPIEGPTLLWAAVGRGILDGEAFAIQLTYSTQEDGRISLQALSLLEGSPRLKDQLELVMRPLTPTGVARLHSLVAQTPK